MAEGGSGAQGLQATALRANEDIRRSLASYYFLDTIRAHDDISFSLSALRFGFTAISKFRSGVWLCGSASLVAVKPHLEANIALFSAHCRSTAQCEHQSLSTLAS